MPQTATATKVLTIEVTRQRRTKQTSNQNRQTKTMQTSEKMMRIG